MHIFLQNTVNSQNDHTTVKENGKQSRQHVKNDWQNIMSDGKRLA